MGKKQHWRHFKNLYFFTILNALASKWVDFTGKSSSLPFEPGINLYSDFCFGNACKKSSWSYRSFCIFKQDFVINVINQLGVLGDIYSFFFIFIFFILPGVSCLNLNLISTNCTLEKWNTRNILRGNVWKKTGFEGRGVCVPLLSFSFLENNPLSHHSSCF